MYELVYTSTPAGLITGRSGFATVALTEGFPPNLIAPVENLSGYKPFFAPGTGHENRNPVNFTCQEFRLGQTSFLVLSRIAYAGLSYTGRSNVLAHHLIFFPEELDEIPGGAVSVLRAAENFPPWHGSPRLLPLKKKVNFRPLPQGGSMWQKLAGDSRWGRYMADRFRSNPEKGFAFSFDPLQYGGTDILELAAETAACLSREELRHFTFSTYCYFSGITNPLFLRSYVKDSVQLGSIRRLDPGSVIYLGTVNALPPSQLDNGLPAKAEEIPAEPKSQTVDPEDIPRELRPEHNAGPHPVKDAEWTVLHEESRDTEIPAASYSTPESGPQGECQSSLKLGKYMVLAVICLIVLGLAAAVSWRIFTGNRKPETLPDIEIDNTKTVVLPADRKTEEQAASGPETMGTAPAAEPPESRKVKPERTRKTGNAAVALPAVRKHRSRNSLKSVSSSRKPSPLGSKPPFGQLTDRELFELYKAFYSGKEIDLPKALQTTEKLELTIHSVGGFKELAHPEKFLSGNGSKSVAVYSRRAGSSGLTTKWEPDKDAAGQMIFQLSDHGSLKIQLPLRNGKEVPRKDDIRQLKFISRGGKSFLLDAGKIPSCFDRILNGEMRIIIKEEYGYFRFLLVVSDDLWTFRRFYTVAVNGSNKGHIDRREILLHELDLNLAGQKGKDRDNSLRKLQELEKEEQDFLSGNRRKLKKPELAVNAPEELKMKLEPKLAKINRCVQQEDEEMCMRQLKEVREIIQKAAGKKGPGEECQEILDELENFKKDYQAYTECKAKLAAIRKSHEACRTGFNKKNSELKKELENLSSALFRAVRDILEESTPPRPLGDVIGIYRKLDPRERLRDIKAEIIRRTVHE